MKIARLIAIVAGVIVLWSAPSQLFAECTKNISFAVTGGGEPVATVPGFVAEWISKEGRQQRFAGFCYSQSPDPRSKNYAVVFAAQKESFNGLVPSILKYVNSAPVSQESTFKTLYGQMWHYMVTQPSDSPATIPTLLRVDTSVALFVRAYNEQGVVVSELSLKDVSGWFHTRPKLLEKVLKDIRGDNRQVTGPPTAIKTSLPVYYVNCDVPVKSLTGDAGGEATPNPQKASPSQKAGVASAAVLPTPSIASVDFWSTPAPADVYVDGRMMGRTPMSLTLEPGEHTITMKKENFTTWERRIAFAGGKRRVSGYLDQKVLTLGLVSH
jgi:hypothetical protein